MAYGVHTSVQPMKPSHTHPAIEFFLTPASLQKLPPPHHPVLFVREPRNRPVISARPQKPVFNKGFCGFASMLELGGHDQASKGSGGSVSPPASLG
jgi:hypothetical protein